MSLSLLFRHLVQDNPMTLEGTRAWRRFLRTGGDTGRGVNIAILSLFGILYVWLLAAIVSLKEDMSQPLLCLELVVLTLFVPASLYGAISTEREKLTWDALILTRLTPGQILVGKLLWRLALVVGIMLLYAPPLLLGHFAPLMDQAHGNGSQRSEFSLADIASAQVLLFGWSFCLGGFSLAVSARTKRSVTSLSLVAVTLLTVLVLVPVLVGLFGGSDVLRFDWSPLSQLGAVLLHLNPMDALFRLFEASYNGDDQWRAMHIDTILPGIYAGGGVLFLLAALKTLRGLEAARKRVW